MLKWHLVFFHLEGEEKHFGANAGEQSVSSHGLPVTSENTAVVCSCVCFSEAY